MVTQKLGGINGHQLLVQVNNERIGLLMELVMHRPYWTRLGEERKIGITGCFWISEALLSESRPTSIIPAVITDKQ